MFANLHNHTHFSLLDGLSKPDKIIAACAKYKYPACAMTDHGNISGAVDFINAAKKAKIKPILGNEFYVCDKDATIKDGDNRKLTHLCVLAKNKDGWRALMQATNLSNSPSNFYYKPRMSLESLADKVKGNCIAFSGHPGSHLANILFGNIKLAYQSKTRDQAKGFLKSHWLREAIDMAGLLNEMFGDFRIEIQAVDTDFPVAQVIAECLREVAQKTSIRSIATGDCHYVDKSDVEDHRILLCCNLKTNIKKIYNQMEESDDVAFSGFFRSNKYGLPTPEELEKCNTATELKNTLEIAEACETYSLNDGTRLPQYPDANGDAQGFLTQLCRNNWSRLVGQRIPASQHAVYVDRIKHELEVIKSANLAGYFCIVQDICDYARKNEWLMSPGRGSAGGCLTSYLAGITNIDPILYNLSFERFYNAGRNTATKVSLPDIDCDFPKYKRPLIIKYIEDKYGSDRVAHIVTFGRMQGRSALDSVLRANGACSFDEAKKMTQHIPDESKIADELENMDDRSIIRWTLMNKAKDLKKWCVLNKDGSLSGDYADYFAQAIRLEGTKNNKGKHASGIIISDQPLSECCPMVYDEHDKKLMCGFEFEDLEDIGFVKFDILGVLFLDRVQDTISAIRGELC